MSENDLKARRERRVIEVAPLAFMRGRTLSNAFVIVDEAQNATVLQMKMTLTRLGEGSRMVVTGDPSQIDLVRPNQSGLAHAISILEDVRVELDLRAWPAGIHHYRATYVGRVHAGRLTVQH